jgi:protein ImuA
MSDFRPPASPVAGRAALLAGLRQTIRRLEGNGEAGRSLPLGVPALDDHLPGGGLALGCVHELAPAALGDEGAATGFAAVLLRTLARERGRVLWLSRRGDLHPPGLAGLGLSPEPLLLARLHRDQGALWAMEEALRCRGLAAVLAEVGTLDLVASRRLQLAAEDSGVTGLLLRPANARTDASAAVTRWRLACLPAGTGDGQEPWRWRWAVELLRCRGGHPGRWRLEMHGQHLIEAAPPAPRPAPQPAPQEERKPAASGPLRAAG